MNKKFKPDDRVLTSVRSWTLGKSKKKGTPFIRVNLENYIQWTGYLSGGALEITMGGLKAMGFKSTNLKDLARDNALDTEKEVVAVIESSREYNGKTYYDAKFINTVNKTGFSAPKDETVFDDLEQIDIRGYMDDVDQSNSNAFDSEPPAVSDPSFDNPTFTADDIPF